MQLRMETEIHEEMTKSCAWLLTPSDANYVASFVCMCVGGYAALVVMAILVLRKYHLRVGKKSSPC